MVDELFVFALAWSTPILVAGLTAWVVLVAGNPRARHVLWPVYAVWSVAWLWFWLEANHRPARAFDGPPKVLLAIGLWFAVLVGLALIAVAHWASWRSQREDDRVGFDVLRPSGPLTEGEGEDAAPRAGPVSESADSPL